MTAATNTTHAGRGQLALFAAGDFAFNLCWQSVMLYLLFYYTEALHLSVATAALCFAIASVWDGIANLIVGVLADRFGKPRYFRRALMIGAIPLGASFVFAYAPPPLSGPAGIAWVIGGHLLFRTAYAMVNVPYLAMSARISVDSGDRAFVAGGRMVCGTFAAVTVAVGTVPLGRFFTGTEDAAAYAIAALIFAIVSSALLIAVGIAYRDDGAIPPARSIDSIRGGLRMAARNRAFVTLIAAAMALVVAVTVLDKSVLYYFKYGVGDERAGQLTLGWMMATSGCAVPVWMLASRYLGVRGTWMCAVSGCIACLLALLFAPFESRIVVQIFLVAIQSMIVGTYFAFWAMLPDTIEYGQRQTGIRAEALLYGLAALLQRLAIGAGTLVVGSGLGRVGLAHMTLGPVGFRLLLAVYPLGFFVLAGLIMLASPLRRGSHADILAELAERKETGRKETTG